jgi:hypothetical protein
MLVIMHRAAAPSVAGWFRRSAPPMFRLSEKSAKNRQTNRRAETMPRGGRRSTSFKPGLSGNPGGRPRRLSSIEARQVSSMRRRWRGNVRLRPSRP